MLNTILSKFPALVFLAIFCYTGNLQAQQAITSFGGDASCDMGTLSYSGGEIAVRTVFAPAITVVNITESFSEGVQQPYTSRDARYNGIDTLSVGIAIYPNPTSENITIECSQPTQLTYTLYNANGQALSHGTWHSDRQTVSLHELPAGSYMLHIAYPDKSKTNIYKIIKAH